MSLPAPNEAIAALEEVLGPESTREIVRLFVAEFPESVRGISSGGREEQIRLIHGIKSSSRHVGASRLAARMADLEGRLGGSEGTLSPADLSGAIADFGAIEPSLRRYAAAGKA